MAISGRAAKPVAAGATAALAALLAWTVGASDSERALSRSVASALGSAPVAGPPASGERTPEGFNPQALRLSSWPGSDLARGLTGQIRVGDTITIGHADSGIQTLEVIESRPFDLDVTRIETGADQHLVLVTARVVGTPDRLVRFIVEATGDDKPAALRSHRAL